MKEGSENEHLSVAWEYPGQSRNVIHATFSRPTMPANAQTSISTREPTNAPTPILTDAPTPTPTKTPTNAPTASPSQVPTSAPSPQTWGATLDIWTGINGDTIASLLEGTNNLQNNPNQSTLLSGTALEVPPNTINADNLGVRVRGWLLPPTTGTYEFWIAADSRGELWLSSNGNPANKEKICEVSTTSVGFRVWETYPEQRSVVTKSLVAGQAYYYEVRTTSSSIIVNKRKKSKPH